MVELLMAMLIQARTTLKMDKITLTLMEEIHNSLLNQSPHHLPPQKPQKHPQRLLLMRLLQPLLIHLRRLPRLPKPLHLLPLMRLLLPLPTLRQRRPRPHQHLRQMSLPQALLKLLRRLHLLLQLMCHLLLLILLLRHLLPNLKRQHLHLMSLYPLLLQQTTLLPQ